MPRCKVHALGVVLVVTASQQHLTGPCTLFRALYQIIASKQALQASSGKFCQVFAIMSISSISVGSVPQANHAGMMLLMNF